MSRINFLIPITERTFAEWHAAEHGPRTVCTPAEVAQYLDVYVTTIWRWLEEGTLPGIRPTRFWILMTAEIDSWITDTLTAQAEREAKKK